MAHFNTRLGRMLRHVHRNYPTLQARMSRLTALLVQVEGKPRAIRKVKKNIARIERTLVRTVA